jgi:endogenous inhibitor of DNA gyrase (YacG/DUF329 family)
MKRSCPICRGPVAEGAEHRPFCSARCKDVDLGHWLNESYRISRPMDVGEVEQVLEELPPPEDPSRLN